MNGFFKFFCSIYFKLLMLFLINLAVFLTCIWFNVLYIYFAVSLLTAFISIFFLANRKERDVYKVIVFLTIIIMPLVGIGYGIFAKDKKGNKSIKKKWSDIIYRNRKSVFSSSETMQTLKQTNNEVYKTCSYLVDTVGLPCFQNAKFKYYDNGEEYFRELFEECKNASNYILFECYKIVPGKLWSEFFDILRLKAREGVKVKLIYDDAICTKFISSEDYEKMKNHGIETIPFNKVGNFNGSLINCRNYKRLCIVDGKVGFFSGYNLKDEYIPTEENLIATKDCGLKITGEAVKNLIVMFFEDYQFATNKVINLQEYFADNSVVKTNDWILPYSTNPISLENTNKNILLSMINNSKENISISTSYIVLDDELKNALIVNAKSGVKVRLVFSGENTKKRMKNLSRSYFYDLIKEGIEVYEYKGGKMSTKLILIDSNTALVSTNNLDCINTYKHFNAGVYVYGESVSQMYNDMREIISNSQLITIKDLQKRKLSEKFSATWSKFIALFR
ncbi:MAG: phosphatidylserine/phosphatidylglycerophosphate/cardiolipin synthase family protein [Christensenellales bacterium]